MSVDFIAFHRALGDTHVVLDRAGGLIGWGRTPDEAWHMALYFANNHHEVDDLGDAGLHAVPDGRKIEGFAAYIDRWPPPSEWHGERQKLTALEESNDALAKRIVHLRETLNRRFGMT